MVLLYISNECIKGDIYWVRVEDVEVTNGAEVTEMAKMGKMSKCKAPEGFDGST
jgi:hypothetical protein